MSLALGAVAAIVLVCVVMYVEWRSDFAERRWAEARELGDRARALNAAREIPPFMLGTWDELQHLRRFDRGEWS